MTTKDLLKEMRAERGMSLSELAKITGISKATLHRYESGATQKIPLAAVFKIELALGLQIGTLMGWQYGEPLPEPGFNMLCAPSEPLYSAHAYPVVEEATFAHEKLSRTTVEIPNTYLQGYAPEDFFVFGIKGDCMFPLYREGDKILVLKQSSLKKNDEIAVVIYGDRPAVLRKVDYKKEENEMHISTVNPNYPPVILRGKELLRCCILGIPKFLMRNI